MPSKPSTVASCRRDFLEILQRGEASGIKNDIFADFRLHLQGIEEAVQSFPNVPPQAWERKQWIGFFTALRDELGDGEWRVRGHSGGSSLAFRWHWKDNKFLALLAEVLGFRIEATNQMQQEALTERMAADAHGKKWDCRDQHHSCSPEVGKEDGRCGPR